MSVSVNINVSGAEEFKAAISRFDSEMERQVQARLADWAESVRCESERLVPVRTGYLRSTIFAKAAEWQMEVGAQAAYAAAVEFGTSHSQAKPYLNPAVEAHLPELEAVLLQAIDSAKMEAQI
jgi:HK97 gp10 family phage protein